MDQRTQTEVILEEIRDLLKGQSTDWVSIADAAVFCSCSYDTIYKAIQSGDLQAANIGSGDKKSTYRISKVDLNSWMNSKKNCSEDRKMQERVKKYLTF